MEKEFDYNIFNNPFIKRKDPSPIVPIYSDKSESIWAMIFGSKTIENFIKEVFNEIENSMMKRMKCHMECLELCASSPKDDPKLWKYYGNIYINILLNFRIMSFRFLKESFPPRIYNRIVSHMHVVLYDEQNKQIKIVLTNASMRLRPFEKPLTNEELESILLESFLDKGVKEAERIEWEDW